MHEQFQKAFDDLQAPQQLKRAARAHIRRKTFDYGRQVFQYRQHRRRIAAGVLSLVLAVFGTGIWFLPWS